jgi:hypothetical protein
VRVSLAQPRHPVAVTAQSDAVAPIALVSRAGPRVVLGGETHATGDFSRPIVPSATALFGPRAAVLAAARGPLVVADTGHHRVLVWHRAPERDGTPADVVLGQPDFETEGRNARGAVSELTCNVPVGLATQGGVLAVADSWNHRVLIWHRIPEHAMTPPDVVLGQGARDCGSLNRGATVAADTLYWCSGVAFTERGLLVADTGNRRVLVWDAVPEADGAPADRVLGQRDFATRDENGGAACGATGMRWPHDVLVLPGGALVVSDAGNNRVMIWNELPARNGAPCDAILGQRDAAGGDHNGGTYWPTSSTLNMPYSCTVARETLVVADTANSRLVGWRTDDLRANAHASSLVAQPDFLTKGDNRWGPAVRDSLCWPYGVSACGETLAIADSGNSRVVLWDLA